VARMRENAAASRGSRRQVRSTGTVGCSRGGSSACLLILSWNYCKIDGRSLSVNDSLAQQAVNARLSRQEWRQQQGFDRLGIFASPILVRTPLIFVKHAIRVNRRSTGWLTAMAVQLTRSCMALQTCYRQKSRQPILSWIHRLGLAA
jgi:hypothetical protein